MIHNLSHKIMKTLVVNPTLARLQRLTVIFSYFVLFVQLNLNKVSLS